MSKKWSKKSIAFFGGSKEDCRQEHDEYSDYMNSIYKEVIDDGVLVPLHKTETVHEGFPVNGTERKKYKWAIIVEYTYNKKRR